MIPRKTEWSILAQCDLYVVQEIVQTSDRIAMKTVQPLKEPIFYRKIENSILWKEAYKSVRNAYESLTPFFSIVHDRYGGYKLLYNGKDVIKPPYVFKKNPIGFVKVVPKGAVSNLSVMTSERTGQELLLLGPLRFVNSDCNPNCEYDYSGDAGLVQLRVKRKISPGDELLVKYGPEFFESNSCLCRSCDILEKEEKRRCNVFNSLVDDLIKEFSDEALEEIRLCFMSPDVAPFPKKRRIKGRELIEAYNELEGSPVARNKSPLKDSNSEIQSACSTCSIISSSDSDLEISPAETSKATIEDKNELESKNFKSSAEKRRASSPVQSFVSFNCSLSTVSKEQISLSAVSLEDSDEENSETLFTGSCTTVGDASMLTELFCSKFNLSDECSNSLYSLIKVILPEDNKFPSGYSHIKSVKDNFDDNVRAFIKTTEYSLCILNFTLQLRDVLSRYFRQITCHSQFRKANPCKDFTTSLCPLVEWNTKRKTTINLTVFSDGVNIKKSTFKKELWPLWIQIADLPPKLRMARKNIVLGALFVGDKYPPWDVLVPHLKDELSCEVKLEMNEHTFCIVTFEVRLLIADLGAKSHMLNMLKFNGFYGCHFCTAQGVTIGRTHAYYPYTQQGKIREPAVNDVFVEMAETMSVEQKLKKDHAKKLKVNVVGVRGKSAFSQIINGLPLSAPIDYMHCVLSGVFTELLKTCYSSLTKNQKDDINLQVAELSCPREMIAFSRKVRPLEELAQYKANELLNWLIYLSPILFLEYLSLSLYSHLSSLVFGIRLLLESNSESSVAAAEGYLNLFCQEISFLHTNNSRAETINTHCLRHLPDQVKRYGPLFCQSAMAFESANRTLGEVFSGANSECEIICRRVLQRHKLVDNKIKNEKLQALYSSLSGKPHECGNLAREFIETEAVQEIKLKYPNALFFNRQTVNNVYFDSPTYKRSKLANCFVSFEKDNREFFGKIEVFIQCFGPPFFNQVVASVQIYSVLEDIGLQSGFYYRVQPTEEKCFIQVQKLKKVFCLQVNSNSRVSIFIIKLLDTFEHS